MNIDNTRKFMQDLKNQLARGEITRAEFEEARAPIRAAILKANGMIETPAEIAARANHFNLNK
jgi:Short C-terminal domain